MSPPLTFFYLLKTTIRLALISAPLLAVSGVALPSDIDFARDVRPIINTKCIACHACYDAPCQLKLDSVQGIPRGASKIRVYKGDRLKEIPPTRLGVDATTVAEWREKGFFDIFRRHNPAFEPVAQSMIDLGRDKGLAAGQPIPKDIALGLSRRNSCPTQEEFAEYAKDHPQEGMPLAVSGLTDEEYAVLSRWIEQGAHVPREARTRFANDDESIQRWEAWLNRQDDKSRLLARYLYEHLFLAHLYFDAVESVEQRVFFQLVRSSTPPGEPVVELTTARPNDDPGGSFYYRLRRVDDTIVYKTHITYYFGPDRLNQYEETFNPAAWGDFELPGYGYRHRANPFLTFRAIPAKARYRFLLEDAEFFVRTFIRGPVCRGQVATDVIRDQFWVMFESPDIEQFSNQPAYQESVISLLGLPGEKTSLLDLGTEWFKYKKNRNRYLELRRAHYNKQFPAGPGIDHIWNGDGNNRNAFLSVFRHHDSASVVKGWVGTPPLTAWIMDFPLIERTVYELVVGFNVFGSVSHQAQTRLYFDLIRNEGETTFLQLLSPAARKAAYESWYQKSGLIKTAITYHDLDHSSPSAVEFTGEDQKTELLQKIAARYPRLTTTGSAGDPCQPPCGAGQDPDSEDATKDAPPDAPDSVESIIRLLESKTAKNLPVVRWLPEVSFVAIGDGPTPEKVYTLLRNRRHSNVAFMFGEALRYQKDRDSLTIANQLIGSYPNLIFNVAPAETGAFFQALLKVERESDFDQLLDRFAVRRMDPGFWSTFHGFTRHLQRELPLEAGIFDLNRYIAW